jgi:hypothetical protein
VTVKLCYCDIVKNVTVAVPDDVYRAARIRAAERGTSVSALVTEYLNMLSQQATEFPRLEAQQRRIQRGIKGFRASDRVGRDEAHVRSLR